MPDEITAEQIAAWEESRQKFVAEHGEVTSFCGGMLQLLVPGYEPPDTKEMWYAGCWLNGMLQEAGASEDVAAEICFAHGQKSVFANLGDGTVWDIAAQSLQQFKDGHWDKPGEELAERLNQKYLVPLVKNGRAN